MTIYSGMFLLLVATVLVSYLFVLVKMYVHVLQYMSYLS